MDEMKCRTERIEEGVWQFEECFPGGEEPYVNAYLIIGSKRALLVDCLQLAGDVYEKVRGLTELPVDVVITHGHGDHAGVSLRSFKEAGCRIYMNLCDLNLLNGFFGGAFADDFFHGLHEEQRFDLGGRVVEVMAAAGHTKGSVVLFDSSAELLFSGDSIGSGEFWMQIPGTLPLADYLRSVEGLWDKLESFRGLKIYPGHRNQSPVQLTGRYIKDNLSITRQLVERRAAGEAAHMELQGVQIDYCHISYGTVLRYCYNPATIDSCDAVTEKPEEKDGLAHKMP